MLYRLGSNDTVYFPFISLGVLVPLWQLLSGHKGTKAQRIRIKYIGQQKQFETYLKLN